MASGVLGQAVTNFSSLNLFKTSDDDWNPLEINIIYGLPI